MQRGETQRWTRWVVAVVALSASGLTTWGTQAAHAGGPASPSSTSQTAGNTGVAGSVPVLPVATTKWSGEAAITRLGTRLPDVARVNGLSEAALRNHFREDATLKVDATDRLFYMEPAITGAGTTAAAASTTTTFDPTIDPLNALALHSKPGSNRVIFLDFDGFTMSGNAWSNSTGGSCFAEPYDMDNTPGTFSTSERNNIISVWRRVAEDYAPFDVDVTTEDPGYDAINRASSTDTQFGTRLIVTYSKSLCPNGKTMYASICAGGCGGIAYVGVYDNTGTNHDYYQPAIVFQNGVTSNPKYVAEAASHEVGHNVGLSHDGTSTTGYYQGQGSWAPIMGVGYYKAISQWSKGEYTDANNTQDDFAVAVSNGLLLRADDYGNTAGTSTALASNPSTIDGVIGSAADVDAFTITTQAGAATFSVVPSPVSPDADLKLSVLDANGTVLGTADPASGSTSYDTSTGMDASLSLDLVAGTYTVLVQGTGYGDPASTGYSAYGSTGYYRLTASVTGTVTVNQKPTASITATPTSGVAPLPVSFTGSGSSDPESSALTYAWTFGDGGTSTAADPTYTYATAGTYTATLTVTDDQGATGSASVVITVTAPVRRIDVASMTISGTRNSSNSRTNATATATIRDSSGIAVSGASVTGRWYFGSSVYSTRTVTSSSSGVATFSFSNVKVARGTVVKLCVTNVALTGTNWDTTVYAPTTATDCITWTAP